MERAPLIAISILVLISLGAILHFAGFLDASSDNTHRIEAFGQNWTVTAPWTSQRCSSNNAMVTHVDNSRSDLDGKAVINFGGKVGYCGDANSAGGTVRLDLDLRKVKKLTIHRSVSLDAYGDDTSTVASNINDISDSKSSKQGSTASMRLTDVYITNDGTVIRITSTEGTQIYPANQPLFFENSVSVRSHKGEALAAYVITGIDLEMKPEPKSSITTPVYSPPAPAQDPDLQPTTEKSYTEVVVKPVSSWWSRFWNWIKFWD